MKRIGLLILFAFLLTSCGSHTQDTYSPDETGVPEQIEETPKDDFAGHEIDDHFKYLYTAEDRCFDKFFSPEEYVKICSVATDLSAEPCYAISEFAFSVHQNIATYNTSEDNYLVIDPDGNVLIDYDDNDWVVDGISNYIRFGNLIFIKTNGNPAKYDIVNQHGKVTNSIKFDDNLCPEYIKDLGNDYYLFAIVRNASRSSYDLYILHPTGECYQINDPMGYWNADIDMDISTEGTTYSIDAAIGELNEDLFSVCYSGHMVNSTKKTCAYYCDKYGNLAINLSSDEMNFHIKELGDFSDGKAEITFVGADKKNYTATINTSGEFIDGPTSTT